jgi:IMP dehydrogenase
VGTLEEVLLGPSQSSAGDMNLFGALRKAMATCGYSDVKSFQRVDVVTHHGK